MFIVFFNHFLVANRCRHIAHHLRAVGFVAGAEVVFVALLKADPVAETGFVVLLCRVEHVHVGVHLVVVVVDEAHIASFLIQEIGNDHTRITPAGVGQAADKAFALHRRGVKAVGIVVVLCEGVHDVAVVLEEGGDIVVVHRSVCKDLRVSRPAHALGTVRAVGRDAQVVCLLAPFGVFKQLVDAFVVGRDKAELFAD